MSDVDETRLLHWLEESVPHFAGPATIRKFAGGQSNPTYRIDGASGGYVLRRKPFGTLLPSAHAVEREYRLLRALHPTGFPVPRPLALCEDADVIGSVFYVMELIEGVAFWNGALPELPFGERRPTYDAMIKTLARLHAIDPDAVGLKDLRRPGNYFERQVDRWTKQYRASQTDAIADVDRLIEWLRRTLPEQTRTSLVHGDYRIDNLLFHPDRAQISAVLDWELATIGDPMADVAYVAMNWVLPADGRAGLAGLDLAESGLPTMDEVVAAYCSEAGIEPVPDLHWHFAFNLFRLTSIVQGVKKRLADDNASSAQAHATVALLPSLIKAACLQAGLAGA